MTINIVASGQSAQYWDGKGTSIGCNDCFKWGHHPTYLLLLDSPMKFRERLEVIKNTLPQRVFTNNTKTWGEYFPEVDKINTEVFRNKLKGKVHHSQTSPFPAITMAYNWGAKDIVLWGVDFMDHHLISPGKSTFISEMQNYKSLFEVLNNQGVRVWLGSKGSYFDKQLPVWSSAQ